MFKPYRDLLRTAGAAVVVTAASSAFAASTSVWGSCSVADRLAPFSVVGTCPTSTTALNPQITVPGTFVQNEIYLPPGTFSPSQVGPAYAGYIAMANFGVVDLFTFGHGGALSLPSQHTTQPNASFADQLTLLGAPAGTTVPVLIYGYVSLSGSASASADKSFASRADFQISNAASGERLTSLNAYAAPAGYGAWTQSAAGAFVGVQGQAPIFEQAAGADVFFRQSFAYRADLPAGVTLDMMGSAQALLTGYGADNVNPSARLIVNIDVQTAGVTALYQSGHVYGLNGPITPDPTPPGGPVTPVPEPSTWALMALGLAGLWGARRSSFNG